LLALVEGKELRRGIGEVKGVVAAFLGFGDRVAPGRIEAADEMAAVERVGRPIRLECRLLAVELIADLEIVLDAGIA